MAGYTLDVHRDGVCTTERGEGLPLIFLIGASCEGPTFDS